MWHFFKRSPITAAVVGALFLIALTAVLYAIITQAADEGFKQVGGKRLRWDARAFPLVCFHEHDVPQELLALYAATSQTINDVVGTLLFRPCTLWVSDKLLPTIPLYEVIYLQWGVRDIEMEGVVFEDENDVETGGRTVLYFDQRTGRLRGTIVQIAKGLPEDKGAAVMLHELGHVLGLDHDRVMGSIMYPNVSGRPGGLTTKDIELLRKAYRGARD